MTVRMYATTTLQAKSVSYVSGWEMSTRQGAVTVFFGREGNRGLSSL